MSDQEGPARELLLRLNYLPESGEFTWARTRRRDLLGQLAGRIDTYGYRQINAGERAVFAHRLVWLAETDTWPLSEIDHINGKRDDNRFANLRLATRCENMANQKVRSNNRSGFRGVSLRESGKWRALLVAAGRRHHLGHFDTKEEAAEAYRAASDRLLGDFGRPS